MNKRILIVEDDFIAAKVAAYHLKHSGCEIVIVEDGLSALELLTTHHEDYKGVYMDMGIPIISGPDLCKAVRTFEAENVNLKPIPIIAVTANYSSEAIKLYLSVGMQEVINKPLTREKIKQFLIKCELDFIL
ncbi:MAG: response regulator [Tatlockia sp.]|nr:response regulator [Tatlockia sp.]